MEKHIFPSSRTRQYLAKELPGHTHTRRQALRECSPLYSQQSQKPPCKYFHLMGERQREKDLGAAVSPRHEAEWCPTVRFVKERETPPLQSKFQLFLPPVLFDDFRKDRQGADKDQTRGNPCDPHWRGISRDHERDERCDHSPHSC